MNPVLRRIILGSTTAPFNPLADPDLQLFLDARQVQPAPTTLQSDAFTRADSVSTLGSSWNADVGTWGISSNQAYAPTLSGGVGLAHWTLDRRT